LLLQLCLSIVSIAQAIGYATQSHLGKAFKEHFGCSPTEYQKNNQPLPPLNDKYKFSPIINSSTQQI